MLGEGGGLAAGGSSLETGQEEAGGGALSSSDLGHPPPGTKGPEEGGVRQERGLKWMEGEVPAGLDSRKEK